MYEKIENIPMKIAGKCRQESEIKSVKKFLKESEKYKSLQS